MKNNVDDYEDDNNDNNKNMNDDNNNNINITEKDEDEVRCSNESRTGIKLQCEKYIHSIM